MRIQSIDNRTNFGNLCGIRCNEKFRNGTYGYTDNRALLINNLMESEAFKELGELIDYDAEFNFYTDVSDPTASIFPRDDWFSYELKLVPAKKPTPDNKFRNLPIEISVLECKSESPYKAYNMFSKKLDKIDGDSLCNKVKNELIKERNRVRKESGSRSRYNNEVQKAKEAIRNSEIPIDFVV